jgi:hypothetical protein
MAQERYRWRSLVNSAAQLVTSRVVLSSTVLVWNVGPLSLMRIIEELLE